MALSILISDRVKFKVSGTINDENGTAQPFDFSLVCKRLDADTIQTKLAEDGSMIDFLKEVTEDWSGVRGEENKPIPYSADALATVFKIPGIAALSFKAYLSQVGGKEKN